VIVVSDTTPLNYLVLIQAVDALPRLFEEVYAPPSVLREMNDTRAPAQVRAWATAPPAWLKQAEPQTRLLSTLRLGDGEGDAISLAKERGIRDVLIDERIGRKIAAAEGLIALPTLTVLERADEAGVLDFHTAIQRLLQTTFRAPADKVAAALARVIARKQSGR
jgi:predicted nucleic acid-binding protein